MAVHAPKPRRTKLTRRIDCVVVGLTRLSRARAAAVTLLLFASISLTAWWMGPGYSFAALYILPIAVAAWSLGAVAGLATGFAGSTVSLSINGAAPSFAPNIAVVSAFSAAWNLGMRVFANLIITLMVAGFRRTFDLERWRSRHDGLTGALNKHAFVSALGDVTRTARKGGCTLLLAYLDLDRFKAVNDRHGHAAGDDVLRRFAHGSTELLRSGDCFARFGGDEFVILAAAQDVDDALSAGEHIHARLSALLASLPYGVGMSMGAVVIPPTEVRDPDVLVGMADALMYEVKRHGRGALRMAIAGAAAKTGLAA